MENRYSRNRIYLSTKEQEAIKNYPILVGGAGIGSNISECLLRLGFQNLTIVDGDTVEKSNLNRQNYIEADLGLPKVEALKKRLLSINKEANIKTHNCFINSQNLADLVLGHKIAINALDFSTEIPLDFDAICVENDIPVLHPYNLGWAALLIVLKKNTLLSLKKSNEPFNELTIVKHVLSTLRASGKPQIGLETNFKEYIEQKVRLSPPQLAVGSWLAAGMCTQVVFDIALNRRVKYFPEFYFMQSS